VVGLTVIDCKNGGAFGSGLTLTKMDFVTPPAVANTFPPVGRPVTGGRGDIEAVSAIALSDGNIGGEMYYGRVISR